MQTYTIKLKNYTLGDIVIYESDAILFTQNTNSPIEALEVFGLVKEAFMNGVITDLEYVEYIYYFTGIGYDIEGNAIDDNDEIVDIDNGAKKVSMKLYKYWYGNKYAKYFQEGPNPFITLKK
jgi:hypothetical protein